MKTLPPAINFDQAIAKNILRTIASAHDVTVADLKSRSRKIIHYEPRWLAIYLIRQICKATYPKIAVFMGGRDHCSMIYACESVLERASIDAVYKAKLNRWLAFDFATVPETKSRAIRAHS